MTAAAGVGSPSVTAQQSLPDLVATVRRSVVLVRAGDSSGSGVAVTAGVLTNAHVVGRAQTVQLLLPDGRGVSATVVRRDETADLALLVGGAVLPPMPLGATRDVREGDSVFALGHPRSSVLGTAPTLTTGVVSAIRRDRAGVTYIQTDAAISPGSSGGALVDMRGSLIGLTTASIIGGEGLNLAVAGDTIAAFLAGGTVVTAPPERPQAAQPTATTPAVSRTPIAVATVLPSPTAAVLPSPTAAVPPRWGRAGNAAGDISTPFGVAVSPDGSIYVSETGNHRIQRFAPDGTTTALWGAWGLAPGQFIGPQGVVLDSDGNLLVVDSSVHRIQKLAPTGEVLAVWGNQGVAAGQFQDPHTIALDSEGNILVTDGSNHRVQKLSPDGRPIAQWGTRGDGPGQFQFPVSIAVDAQGNVLVGDRTHRIQKFSSSGEWMATFGSPGDAPAQFRFPNAIAVDAAGSIYVADSGNDRIQKLSPDGEPLAAWGSRGPDSGMLAAPNALAFDSAGNLYVSEGVNNRIQKLSPDGEPLAILGTPAR